MMESPFVIDRENYLRHKAQHLQSSIVNFKQVNTSTTSTFIWAYRNTGCDVISVVTTTIPIVNGQMKDIQVRNKELNRIKASTKRPGKNPITGNPLEDGLAVDLEKNRCNMNAMLKNEKSLFMGKLKLSKFLRTTIENRASTAIQTVYRGYHTRLHIKETIRKCLVHKSIRSDLRKHLVTSLGLDVCFRHHRAQYSQWRQKSATIIQCLFRRYISRKCLLRRRREFLVTKRRLAALKMQCLARVVAAKATVALTRNRKRIIDVNRSVVKIQSAARKLCAKRKVRRRRYKLRWIACRMIQCWFRGRHSKKFVAGIKEFTKRLRADRGATGVQRVVRGFICRRRVNRIRMRRMYKLIFKYVAKIQSLLRKFLAMVRVKKARIIRNSSPKSTKPNQFAVKSSLEKEHEQELQQLSESLDMFHQARIGNTTAVSDIFENMPSEEGFARNSDGDTILTIAASCGHIELIRKCFLWGFNLNYRTPAGLTALMLAVKHNHAAAVQYFLSPPAAATAALIKAHRLDDISAEDSIVMLIMATENAVTKGTGVLTTLINYGLELNSVQLETGMTAALRACEVGHVDALKLILKHKGSIDQIDEMGQTAYHKASGSNSVEIVKGLFGLDNSLGFTMTEKLRALMAQKLDLDGKSCLLLAALTGNHAIVTLLQDIVTAGNQISDESPSVTRQNSSTINNEDIGWTPNDINRAIALAEANNSTCLAVILNAGFDPLWPQEITGLTLPMAACRSGSIATIDLLMQCDADFSLVDSHGQTPMHFAAGCKSGAIVAHLLSHEKAKQCKLTEMSLAVRDSSGNTPLHVAAMTGVEMNVDLLAPHGLSVALRNSNIDNMTPLLVACSHCRHKMVEYFLRHGASQFDADSDGHNAIWHWFHPDVSVLHKRRPLGSEYAIRKNLFVPTRRERDDDNARITQDINLLKMFLKSGCDLYSSRSDVTVDAVLTSYCDCKTMLAPEIWSSLESGDIAICEHSYTLLRSIPCVLSLNDCWRLVLSCLRLDDGSCKALLCLLEGGAADVLADEGLFSSHSVVMVADPNVNQLHDAALVKLQTAFFCGMTIAGWIIRLGNAAALQQLIKRGYAAHLPADMLGNSCLHIAARHGNAVMIEVVMMCSRVRLEQVNNRGATACMEGAAAGNFATCKALCKYGANARKGLEGKYWAWLLQMARKREKNEMNLQTGRYGDDDNWYFPIDNDPHFTIWS